MEREIRLGCLQAAVAGAHERLSLDEILLRALELEEFVTKLEPAQAIRERIVEKRRIDMQSMMEMSRVLNGLPHDRAPTFEEYRRGF